MRYYNHQTHLDSADQKVIESYLIIGEDFSETTLFSDQESGELEHFLLEGSIQVKPTV